jgi:inosose dehydratase
MKRRAFIQNTAIMLAAANLSAFAKKYQQKMAYSAITWSGNDLVAIKEIAELGFKGIQLRANTFAPFKDQPEDLKSTLTKNGLSLAMFSSGNVSILDDISKDISLHLNHAKFIKALGGNSLQITNNSRPKDRLPTVEELKKYAKNMSEVAKVVMEETGVQAAYHNHMNQLGETPEEVDVIVNEMNTKYVKLLLDVAHYHQGGGVPAEAVLKYKEILFATHIKDTRSDAETKNGYRFVELGEGKVDFPAIFKNLKKIDFKGWNIVELDAVPVKGRTAFESAQISHAYLSKKININF